MSRIQDYINNLSYNEREKRKLKQYREKILKYTAMDDDELEMNYINIRAAYEHRKNVLAAILGTLLISIIMDTWKYFFEAIHDIIVLMYARSGNEEAMAKLALMLTSIIAIAVFIILLLIVLDLFHKMKAVISERIFIENFMRRKDGESEHDD